MRPVQDCIGERSFRHQRQFCQNPLPVDQCGGVLIAAESTSQCRDIVCDDEVEAFFRQFAFRMGDQIAGFSSEADHELRGPLGR